MNFNEFKSNCAEYLDTVDNKIKHLEDQRNLIILVSSILILSNLFS